MLMCFSVPWFYKSALKRVKAEEKGCAHCLAHGRVTVAPHDAAGAPFDLRVVQGVQGPLGIGDVVVVHVGVAEGLPRDGIAANTNGRDRANSVEDLVQHRFGDILIHIADVERGKLLRATGAARHARTRCAQPLS